MHINPIKCFALLYLLTLQVGNKEILLSLYRAHVVFALCESFVSRPLSDTEESDKTPLCFSGVLIRSEVIFHNIGLGFCPPLWFIHECRPEELRLPLHDAVLRAQEAEALEVLLDGVQEQGMAGCFSPLSLLQSFSDDMTVSGEAKVSY